mgnify:CR=1 FL=1
MWYSLVKLFLKRFVPDMIEYEDVNLLPVNNRIQRSYYNIHEEKLGSKFIRFLLRRKTILDGIVRVRNGRYRNCLTLLEAGNIIKNNIGRRLPIEMGNKESLHQFLMNSGSFLLESSMSNDKWILNMSEYEQYKVRDGFETYGGCVTLNSKEIINVVYKGRLYNKSSEDFDKILNIVRSTLFVKIAVEIHAIRIHLCTAQRFALWTSARYSNSSSDTKFLSDLPLKNSHRYEAQRDLLKIFTFNVLNINSYISLLIEVNGIAHHLTAFEEESYLQFCKNAYAKGHFKRQELLGSPKTSWNKNIKIYIEDCEHLIMDFFTRNDLQGDMDISCDNLVDAIITSTLLHNVVGDDLVYAMSVSGFMPPKLHQQNHELMRKDDCKLLEALLYIITTRIPLLSSPKFLKHFERHDDKYQRAWNAFVDNINEDFQHVKWMDIDKIEISVGY